MSPPTTLDSLDRAPVPGASHSPLALRGALSGGGAALVTWAAFLMGGAILDLAAPTLRALLGPDLGTILGLMIPFGLLVISASSLGRHLGTKSGRADAAAPDGARATVAGAAMGALATGAGLVLAETWGRFDWFGSLLAASLPLGVALGCYGRSAFLALEGPARGRGRKRPTDPVPQLYPGLAAVGLGCAAFVGLGTALAQGLEAAGLTAWFRMVDWSGCTMQVLWGGVLASAAAATLPAALAGHWVAKRLPEARPLTLALAALACFAGPATLMLGEMASLGGFHALNLVGLLLLTTVTGVGGLTAVATAQALAAGTPATRELPASLSA